MHVEIDMKYIFILCSNIDLRKDSPFWYINGEGVA